MISPITREEILDGFGVFYHCCMFGINKAAFRCDMWREIFDEVGGIGFLAREKGEIVGQMIFLPKRYARRICLATSSRNRAVDTTIVIGCLYVIREYANRGIASTMIARLLEFCRGRGFTGIEACVDPRPADESGLNTSFYPFRKFGFVLGDDTGEVQEFSPEARMCWCDLSHVR